MEFKEGREVGELRERWMGGAVVVGGYRKGRGWGVAVASGAAGGAVMAGASAGAEEGARGLELDEA